MRASALAAMTLALVVSSAGVPAQEVAPDQAPGAEALRSLAREADDRRRVELARREQEALHRLGLAGPAGEGAGLTREGRDALYRYMRDKKLSGEAVSEAMVRRLEAEADAADAALRPRIEADRTPPVLDVPDRIAFDRDRRGAPLIGRAADDVRLDAVTVDGERVEVGSDGGFVALLPVPLGGEREVVVVARDRAGNEARRTILASRRPPPAETTATAAEGPPLPPLDLRKAHGRPQPDAAAVAIGVGTYASLPPAPFAERDAQAFADYAIYALGVPEDRVLLLTDEQATRENILREVRQMALDLGAKGPVGQVFVLLSGHGLATDGEPVLVAQDADPVAPGRSAVAAQEVASILKAAAPRAITVFADTSYSGRLRDQSDAAADPAGEAAVVTALSLREPAARPERVRYGAFSYALMKGLEGGADLDGDKRITLGEVERWLDDQLPRLGGGAGGEGQQPASNGVDPGRVLCTLE